MPGRVWDIRELAAGDARGLRRGSDDPDAPEMGQVIRRWPDTPFAINRMFQQSSAATKDVIREIARLGYDVEEFTPDYVALTGVGRGQMEIVLVHSGEFPIEITRVKFGTESWTARQGADWLRKRAAR